MAATRLRPAVCLGVSALLATLLPATFALGQELLHPEEILLSQAEREVFDQLAYDEARDEFLEQMWATRSPEFTAAWHQRLPLATREFTDLGSDRARHFLLAGPPLFRLSDLCPPPVAAHEIWSYSEDGSKSVAFVADAEGHFEQWTPRDWTRLLPGRSGRFGPAVLRSECARGEELAAALAMVGSEGPRLPLASDPDWLTGFLDQTTLVAVADSSLSASVRPAFRGRVGTKTATTLVFDIEGEDDADLAGAFLLVGEVLDGERLIDSFRIRFEPEPRADESVRRLIARRRLPPGQFSAAFKIKSLVSRGAVRLERPLHVPKVDVLAEGAFDAGESLFKLLPTPDGFLVGNHRIETVGSEGVARVTFYLNGARVMSKNRPPFSVELDLGALPRPQEVEAVALDSAGREIARDRMTVNSGPHRFAIRLIEPRTGSATKESTTAHAEVHTPLGENLAYVDFFWNEARVARLFQEPFVHTFETPPEGGSSYLRAVAVLDDGHSADDLVVVNTGSTTEAIEVDFVELYASVLNQSGAAVFDLEQRDFTVYEDGVEQEIRRFETVRHLPVNAAMVLDTSTSMEEEIEDVEQAAARFVESVLAPKDRAAVVVFSDGPELRVPLTNDLDQLGRGLSGIEADGETSLYDTLIYGLYYLTGLRGKRALVLVSDGADSVSEFSLDDTLDYARRSGVAIYAIGLGLSGRDVEEQSILRRLASETGGGSFFLSSTKRLDKIYAQIEEELRSQYLLGYQSSQSDPGTYRHVEVRLTDSDLVIKTVPGYYP